MSGGFGGLFVWSIREGFWIGGLREDSLKCEGVTVGRVAG
jgi:hypothetical protein